MSTKISDRHLTANNERDRAGEQPDQKQESPGNFDHARDPEQREVGESGIRRARRIPKQLLCTVLEEQQRADNPKHAKKIRSPFGWHPPNAIVLPEYRQLPTDASAGVFLCFFDRVRTSKLLPAKFWGGERMKRKGMRVVTVLLVFTA